MVDWTPASALALNAVVFAITIPASAPYRTSGLPREEMRRVRYDIPLRALTAAVVVAVVTTASHQIGSFVSGMFAVFPIVMGSFVVMHPRVGGPAAAKRACPRAIPLIGLALGFLALHYLAGRIGSWGALAVGLAVCVGWNATVWAFKTARG